MKPLGQRRWRWWGPMLACCALVETAYGQARYLPRYQAPQWFTFHLSEVSAGIYAEGTYEQSDVKGSREAVTYQRWFIGPSLGLVADGSIYHPNLLRYYLNLDGAFGWAENEYRGGATASRDELEFLGRFSASVDLLPGKPYRASAYVDYDHDYRDNDFFSRITVDTWRYGGRAVWETGPWTLNADYAHRDEDSSNPFPVTQVVVVTNQVNGTNVITLRTNTTTLDQHVVYHEDTVTFGVRHERASGGSALNYNFDQYTRVDLGRLGEGTDHTLAFGDSERFGALEKYKLNTSASYSRREATAEQNDETIANANFVAEHRPTLTSFYDLNYDRFTTGSFESDNYLGSASLQHQLYESLTSTLTVHGSDTEISDRNLSGYNRRFGGGFAETYTKRLSDTSRLRLSNSLIVDQVNQENIGIVENEHHSLLPQGENGAPRAYSFFLDFPKVVVASIVITDPGKVVVYMQNLDYRVVTDLGSRVLVEWIVPSFHPRPPTVVADYRTEPTPAASYQSLSETFQIRLEFWQNLLGVYGRLNLSLNNAPAELHIQDFTTYAVGTDLTWRALRAGAEYEIYHSTDADYNALRLFQSVALRPDEASTLTFDFGETWIDYVTSHRQEQDYRFLTRYRRALTHRLAFDAEAGVAYRTGDDLDELLAAFRPSIKYVIGKTTIDAGYNYEYQLFLNREEHQKHMLFVRARRVF